MSERPSILVSIKHVYGARRIYPACIRSRQFAEIAGTRTLSDYTISCIKNLGFDVKVKTEEL